MTCILGAQRKEVRRDRQHLPVAAACGVAVPAAPERRILLSMARHPSNRTFDTAFEAARYAAWGLESTALRASCRDLGLGPAPGLRAVYRR